MRAHATPSFSKKEQGDTYTAYIGSAKKQGGNAFRSLPNPNPRIYKNKKKAVIMYRCINKNKIDCINKSTWLGESRAHHQLHLGR